MLPLRQAAWSTAPILHALSSPEVLEEFGNANSGIRVLSMVIYLVRAQAKINAYIEAQFAAGAIEIAEWRRFRRLLSKSRIN